MGQEKQLTVNQCATKIFQDIFKNEESWNDVLFLRKKLFSEFEKWTEIRLAQQVCKDVFQLHTTDCVDSNNLKFRSKFSEILQIEKEQLPEKVEEVMKILGEKLKAKIPKDLDFKNSSL